MPITITGWRAYEKNTLKGFFSVQLASGLILRDLTLHVRGGARWVGMPAREWTDHAGVRQFAAIVEFKDRTTANRFRDEALAALDAYLATLEEEGKNESAAIR
jgi:hypothetical protein